MRPASPLRPPIFAAVALVLSAIAFLLACGCSGGLQSAQVFRTQAARGLAEFSQHFDAWDRERQERVLAESPTGQKESSLREYIERVQTPVRQGIVAMRGLLAQLSSALAAAERGMKADWVGVALEVVRAGAELVETLRRLGVEVPIDLPNGLAGATGGA